jgi:hypothetical protein
VRKTLWNTLHQFYVAIWVLWFRNEVCITRKQKKIDISPFSHSYIAFKNGLCKWHHKKLYIINSKRVVAAKQSKKNISSKLVSMQKISCGEYICNIMFTLQLFQSLHFSCCSFFSWEIQISSFLIFTFRHSLVVEWLFTTKKARIEL